MVTVLAVGIAVLDVVLTVDELPTKGEKYRASDITLVGGGCAANAAVAVAKLGGHALLATRLGNDRVGGMILDGLRADGVDCTLVRQFTGARSSCSSVIVDCNGERQIVNFRGADLPSDSRWLHDALPAFDVGLADIRWPAGAVTVLQAAAARGLPSVLDAEAPVSDGEQAILTASHVVFSAGGLLDFTHAQTLEDGLVLAAQRCPGFVAVTDGARGTFWYADGAVEHTPAVPVTAVDTLGAGDTWHGAFAVALGERMPMRDAVGFANAAAAIKCTRAGGSSGIPSRTEVDALLNEQAIPRNR